MGKILLALKELKPNEIIALCSVIIATLSLIATILFNLATRRQYKRSRSPLLSFRLIEYNYTLYLAITNTGSSEAKNIKITIDELCNNGERYNLMLSDLFNTEFELYPNETVQGMIGIYGMNIENNVFPYIKVSVEYKKGNDKKKKKYKRIVSFTTAYENKIKTEVDLDLGTIPRDIKALNRSNIRIANYLDGCTLASFDELEIVSDNTLKNDMKEAIRSKNKTKKKDRTETIEGEFERRKNANKKQKI